MTGSWRAATRRRVLRAGAAVGAAGLAGCSLLETRSGGDADIRTSTQDGGDGDDGDGSESNGRVYIPDHFHRMKVAGSGTSDGLEAALLYTLPDFYWRVNADGTTEKVEPEADASLQLRVWVWERESRTVLEDAAVTAELTRDGDRIAEPELLPLLNQRTGLHWTRNLALPAYGTYDVRLQVEPGPARYTGSLASVAETSTRFDLQLPADRGKIQEIETTYVEQADNTGAVQPMSTDAVPLTIQPDPSELPGTVVGTGTSGAAKQTVVRVPADANPTGAGSPYLAVTLTTPFNGYSLPRARLTATLERDGSTVFDDRLRGTLDADRGYHYGASIESIESGDSLTIGVDRPPQVARFAGYDQAFLRMSDTTLSLE